MFYAALQTIGQGIAIAGIAVGGFFGYHQASAPMVGSTIPQVPAFTSDSLASGIGKTDTTMTLVNGTDNDGNSLSGYYGFVIDEGTSVQEAVGCTANGTALTACTRGLSSNTATTTILSKEQVHRRGATVKVTTYPFLGVVANILQGKDGFPTMLYYDTLSSSTVAASTNGKVIPNKDYVDYVGSAGCASANSTTRGCVQEATAVQAASTTATGSTGARLYLPASIATSSDDVVGLHAVITQNSGKINWNQIDLGTAFTVTALATFSNGIIDTASSTIGNGTQATGLTVSGGATTTGNLIVQGTGTSTVAGNLSITGNASTTNLEIFSKCTGCTAATTTLATATLTTSNNGQTTATANCPTGDRVVGGGIGNAGSTGYYVSGSSPTPLPPSVGTGWVGVVTCNAVSLGTCSAGTLTVYAMCVNP